MNPFDFVKDASYDKKNLMRGTDNDDLMERDYNPWLTNIALSYHPDSILYANLMNIHHHLDNRPQYEFYINGLRKRKRFSSWVKKEDEETLILLEKICICYGCSKSTARTYLKLMSNEQIDDIKTTMTEGDVDRTRNT
jgi:hypothetical protein